MELAYNIAKEIKHNSKKSKASVNVDSIIDILITGNNTEQNNSNKSNV